VQWTVSTATRHQQDCQRHPERERNRHRPPGAGNKQRDGDRHGRLAAAIKTVLTRDRAAVERGQPIRKVPGYDREGRRCGRARCTGTIRRRTQAGRSTFYCPVCQR
jgi:hypothetical protein